MVRSDARPFAQRLSGAGISFPGRDAPIEVGGMPAKAIPLDPRQLLDLRIARWKGYRKDGPETELCDRVAPLLPDLLLHAEVGEVVQISREYPLPAGRVDFLCQLRDEQYAIVEVKRESPPQHGDWRMSFAIGQLLVYAVGLSVQHDLPIENVHPVLISDGDLTWASAAVGAYGLPIYVCTLGHEYAKVLHGQA